MIGQKRRWNMGTAGELRSLLRQFETPERRVGAIEQCFKILDEVGTESDRLSCLSGFGLSVKPSDASFDRVGKTLFAIAEAAAEQARSETGKREDATLLRWAEGANLLRWTMEILGSHIGLMRVEQRTPPLFERLWPYADLLADAGQPLDSFCKVSRAAIPSGPDFEDVRSKLGQCEEREAARKERAAIRRKEEEKIEAKRREEENVRLAPDVAKLRGQQMRRHGYHEEYVSAFLEQIDLAARNNPSAAAKICLEAITGYSDKGVPHGPDDAGQLRRIRESFLICLNRIEPTKIADFALANIEITPRGAPAHEAIVAAVKPYAKRISPDSKQGQYLRRRLGVGLN